MEDPPAGEQMPEPAEAGFGPGEGPKPEVGADWDESEEEIFILEEADILEEEELEIDSFATAEATTVGEGIEWGGREEISAAAPEEDVFAGTEPAVGAVEGLEEEFSLGEEGPEWGIAEPEAVEEEPPVFEEEAVPSEPVSPPVTAPATAEGAEGLVQSLSEEELARVVEKVAGTVIERLASTILEKIAWEVVPDLAESMIRDELRSLKAETER